MMPWARTTGTAVGPPTAGAAVGTPVDVQGADGPLSVGAAVQTQFTRDEGGDDSWHAGRVVGFVASGEVSVKYDDGDEWTGSAREVYLLDRAHPPKSVRLQLRHSWEASMHHARRRFRGSMCGGIMCGNSMCVALFFLLFLYWLLPLFADMRTGETALW